MGERHPFLQVSHVGCLVPAIGEEGHEEHNTRDFYAIFFLGIYCVELWTDTIFLKQTGEGEH